jgi:DNA-binding transcriptional ArsR family regulator
MATTQDRTEGFARDGAVTGTLTDPDMIRALSHPARLSIVEYLGSAGKAATATELSEVVGLSPSATSYHLRAMARHGLVEPAEGRGDGRERMWRVVGGGWQVEGDPSAGPERRAAEQALLAAVLARANDAILGWFARTDSEPAEWVDAAAILDISVVATPAELAEITAACRDLLRPYLRRNRPAPPPGARVVAVHYRAVPATWA